MASPRTDDTAAERLRHLREVLGYTGAIDQDGRPTGDYFNHGRPSDQVTPQVAAYAISGMTTREQVEAYLAELKLSVQALKDLADELGPTVAKGTRKDELVRNIVEGTIGFRERSAAMSGGAWEEGTARRGRSTEAEREATRRATLVEVVNTALANPTDPTAIEYGQQAWDHLHPDSDSMRAPIMPRPELTVPAEPMEPAVVWRNPDSRQLVSEEEVEAAFAEAAARAAGNRRGPDWDYGDEPDHEGLDDPLAQDPDRPHLTVAEARRRDAGKCIWVVETGMRPTIRYCPKDNDVDNDDADYCKEHEAEAHHDEDEAAFYHYAEPGGPDYTDWAKDNLPDPDTDWTNTEGADMAAGEASTLELAMGSAQGVKQIAEQFARVAEKAGADLAKAGLPALDLNDAAEIGDAADQLAQSAVTHHEGLVQRQVPIRDAIAAAGGAADDMSFYGAAANRAWYGV